MRYFTSYLKKVILLRNSRYLQCVTPNTGYVWLMKCKVQCCCHGSFSTAAHIRAKLFRVECKFAFITGGILRWTDRIKSISQCDRLRSCAINCISCIKWKKLWLKLADTIPCSSWLPLNDHWFFLCFVTSDWLRGLVCVIYITTPYGAFTALYHCFLLKYNWDWNHLMILTLNHCQC